MTLAAIFQNGMLLQRDIPAAVWGSARSGEEIHVSIQGRGASAIAGADGRWTLTLPPLCASENETLTLRGADGEFAVRDVAVGEVFLAGGQSNMEFHMDYEAHYESALADCESPNVRFYETPKVAFEGQTPADPDAGVWRKACARELRYFSAAGYYFARELAQALRVPVGIVGCFWGGTRSSAWMTEEHARDVQPEHCAAASMADPQNMPGALYAHMVQRIAPYTARGALWYQGESDDDFVQSRHKAALEAVMADWRSAWHSPALPFCVVQLPGFDHQIDAAARDYPAIRRCQQEAVDGDANAYLCSISDAGEEFNIHPQNKLVVGERLALLAQRHIFGMDVLADAPRILSARREGAILTLTFQNAGNGLYIEGDSLNALEVSAQGHPLSAAACEARGDQLRLTLSQNEETAVTLRFAQTNWFCVNLYSEAGIPAIPFEISL